MSQARIRPDKFISIGTHQIQGKMRFDILCVITNNMWQKRIGKKNKHNYLICLETSGDFHKI